MFTLFVLLLIASPIIATGNNSISTNRNPATVSAFPTIPSPIGKIIFMLNNNNLPYSSPIFYFNIFPQCKIYFNCSFDPPNFVNKVTNSLGA